MDLGVPPFEPGRLYQSKIRDLGESGRPGVSVRAAAAPCVHGFVPRRVADGDVALHEGVVGFPGRRKIDRAEHPAGCCMYTVTGSRKGSIRIGGRS